MAVSVTQERREGTHGSRFQRALTLPVEKMDRATHDEHREQDKQGQAPQQTARTTAHAWFRGTKNVKSEQLQKAYHFSEERGHAADGSRVVVKGPQVEPVLERRRPLRVRIRRRQTRARGLREHDKRSNTLHSRTQSMQSRNATRKPNEKHSSQRRGGVRTGRA